MSRPNISLVQGNHDAWQLALDGVPFGRAWWDREKAVAAMSEVCGLDAFEGRITLDMQGDWSSKIRGCYEWIDRITPEPRVRGFLWPSEILNLDPYSIFNQSQFRGRACRLTIPGIGQSPVRLRSSVPRGPVDFEAWSPPIPIATPKEVVSALWTPVYDILAEHGHDDLAGLVRAACVMIEGFRPDPAKERTRS